MSNPIDRVEIISGTHRRRRYTAEEKVRLVEQTLQPGMTVSAVARLHGVSPSLLFQWKRRMSEGGHEAVRADEEAVPISREGKASGAPSAAVRAVAMLRLRNMLLPDARVVPERAHPHLDWRPIRLGAGPQPYRHQPNNQASKHRLWLIG